MPQVTGKAELPWEPGVGRSQRGSAGLSGALWPEAPPPLVCLLISEVQ